MSLGVHYSSGLAAAANELFLEVGTVENKDVYRRIDDIIVDKSETRRPDELSLPKLPDREAVTIVEGLGPVVRPA